MMKYLAFFLIIFFNRASSQTVTSSCIPSGNSVDIFKNDALRLAIKRVSDINSPAKDSVELPAVFIDSIAKALYAIENMEWSPLKDTIRTLFSYSDFSSNVNEFSKDSLHIMHAGDHNSYKLTKFSLDISSNANWASAWVAGNYSNTSNDTINYLIKRYGLQVSKYSNTFYYISSPAAINIAALMKQFKAISGVSNTYFNNYIGDGQYIKSETAGGNVILSFYHACGDCPSGCTYGRMWKFSVNSISCSVTFISAENWGSTYGQTYTCISQIMPVTFTSLKGQFEKNKVSLVWEVATEANVDKYVIERSVDSKNFAEIGETTTLANGTTHQYLWLDQTPLINNYYRIKSVGINSDVKYTQVVNVKRPNNYSTTSIYPNPAKGRSTNLKFAKPTHDAYFVKMVTITGQIVFTTQFVLLPGISVKEIQWPKSVLPGKYYLYISNGRENEVETLLIQ